MKNSNSNYEKRGVSSSKTEVHEAIAGMDKGILPNSFCKILPDIAGDKRFAYVNHCDTAGTKPSLAVLYYLETGDTSVFRDIVIDAIVMNTDDVACSGFTENLYLSSVIGRNKHLLDGYALKELIHGQIDFINEMEHLGIKITHTGGETADVADIVRTLDVGASVSARDSRNKVIDINITPDMVVVGYASFGCADYEYKVNSGMGANGMTNARHDVLSPYYKKYKESFAPQTPKNLVYRGKYRLEDEPTELGGLTVGKALLSPTRTYLPVLNTIFREIPRAEIGGIIHNTGGGQTKVKNFLPDNVQVIKDNLFETPGIFKLIQQAGTSWKEMYETTNMGHRLEVYVPKRWADKLIQIGKRWSIDTQVVGYTIKGKKSVIIESPYGKFQY